MQNAVAGPDWLDREGDRQKRGTEQGKEGREGLKSRWKGDTMMCLAGMLLLCVGAPPARKAKALEFYNRWV